MGGPVYGRGIGQIFGDETVDVSWRCLRLASMPGESTILGDEGRGRVHCRTKETLHWPWPCQDERITGRYRLYSEPRSVTIQTSVVWFRETVHVSEH